jgi:hypothetical protein
MKELQTILYNLFPYVEFICAIVGTIYYKRLKDTYWKWFVIYVVFIAIVELINIYVLVHFPNNRKYYYGFFVIPIEFLFLYWLYAKKSLQSTKLYWISNTVYIAFYILNLFTLNQVRYISSMTYTVGVFILAIMIYLEFMKQIKSDEILNFKTNKMFYINIAVMLFYIGTLPFFAYDKYLFENMNELWENYKTFFLFSVNIMYILFIMSFIWGKPRV